jgi:hypothetical protein
MSIKNIALTTAQYGISAVTEVALAPVVVVTKTAAIASFVAETATIAYSKSYIDFELAVFDLTYKLETMKGK